MRHSVIYLSTVTFAVSLLATAAPAQMKATAPEKMMPADQAKKMRECDKLAMDKKIKMADRTKFVADCMAKK